MDICFQVVLFQTEKKASIKLIIIYYIFVSFVMFIWIPILFIFNVFFVFFSLFFAFVCWQCWSMSFFNFALNVVFFSVYIICNIEGAASFSSVAVYSLRSLPYACARTRVLKYCACTCVCERAYVWMNICALLSALARLPYRVVVEFKINK